MNTADDYQFETSRKTIAQKLRRIFLSGVRRSAYKHDPLLINSLVAFNFRPPIMLDFPDQRLARRGALAQ